MKLSKEVWAQIALHDKQAYSELYLYFYPNLFNYGKKFTTDTALVEDAVQETLLTIWDKRTSLNEIRSPETYYYNAFKYLLFDRIKRKDRLTPVDGEIENFEFTIDEQIIQKEQGTHHTKQLKTALSTLTPRQREAIFLRFYAQLSYEEVAEIMEITPKATYKIMSRALLQLKEKFVFLLVILAAICLYIEL
ncbi:MAG TPA: sigma-70 family RNA polymerase sigma factor [Niabella sp.]|nr:sigma-70 family RNA polymerase sigma factor [Niabella sp.]HOZ97714.1 sigma-70 family RNA polymerase sigma factor [Niabella sp.]HQW14020.1 sigma-70 family RNA polymerase sigma factor [Niabella sp.]HQX19437.1 sigma-70 family RNA polymerase sigma factor [Niabella sp.]HQX40210.1 sigma-70 family RNA polymerase sigma factor [Niabella sp.]